MSDVQSSPAPQARPKHPVRLERHGNIATILIENPPVNAMNTQVRGGILAALEAAGADPKTDAIVIAASGRTFPAGADITEFGQPPQDPSLPYLCNRVEAMEKPVFAALHGTVLGGGLELAMAAHYRIAAPGTKLGLPEVKLGILPGAGGTQRAPRLIGIEAALTMIQSGAPTDAENAQALGLVDAIDDNPREAAVALAATNMAPRPTAKLRTKLAADDLALLQAARGALPQTPGPQPALARIIDCLEGAVLLPFKIGLDRERAAFEECVTSRDSMALRHLFFAERKAAKFAEMQGGKGKVTGHVAIVGGGLMGSGITLACLNAGLPVTLVEEGEAGVTAALDRIGDGMQRAVARGKISEAQGTRALTRLTLTTRMTEIARADLVIEAVTEDPEAKRQVLARIDQHAKADAVLASNSSYIDPAILGAASGRPEQFVALHFFAPAQIMRLVEIGVSDTVVAEAVARVQRFCKGLGKTPVRSAARPGLIVNRILMRARLEADAMLEDGATPAQIDAAMRGFGFPLGPYEVLDRSGLDISYIGRKLLARPEDERRVEIADRIVEAGLLGREFGQGYYLYSDGGPAVPNPIALAIIETLRAEKGITPRDFSNREICDRILSAMVNEGAVLLEKGVATRPSDIDVAIVRGLGYPERRGGPMFDADQTSVFEFARRIGKLAAAEPDLWSVAPLIERLGRERANFDSLN